MNRRLRKRHGRMMAAMGLLLPIGVGLALYARPVIPVESAGLQRRAVTGADEIATPERAALDASARWSLVDLTLRVWPPTADEAGIVELTSTSSLALPDVLLYWSRLAVLPEKLSGTDFLLGTFFGTHTQRFHLPAGAAPGSGGLILYSLAHDEVIGYASLMGLDY